MISFAQCLYKASTICRTECLWLTSLTRLLIVLTREHGYFVRLYLEGFGCRERVTSLYGFCPLRKLVLCTLHHLFPPLLLCQHAVPNCHSPCFSNTYCPADGLLTAGQDAAHHSKFLIVSRRTLTSSTHPHHLL